MRETTAPEHPVSDDLLAKDLADTMNRHGHQVHPDDVRRHLHGLLGRLHRYERHAPPSAARWTPELVVARDDEAHSAQPGFEHHIEERAVVYLRLAPDRQSWMVDQPTFDGYPLEGYDGGAVHEECDCTGPEALAGRRLVDAVDKNLALPTAVELIHLLITARDENQ